MYYYPDMHLHISSSSELNLHPHVSPVFLNATSEKDFNAVEGASEDKRVFPFFGIHPWNADEESGPEGKQSNALKIHLDNVHCCGIGECGLDKGPKYKNNIINQREAFENQLRLAFEYGKPLSVHCVQAWGLLLEVISRFAPLPRPLILHSFYGSAEILQRLLKLGAYISLSSLSLRNPVKSSPVIKQIPLNRLLVESDLQIGSKGFSSDMHFQVLRNNYKDVADIKSINETDLVSGVSENGKIFTN